MGKYHNVVDASLFLYLYIHSIVCGFHSLSESNVNKA